MGFGLVITIILINSSIPAIVHAKTFQFLQQCNQSHPMVKQQSEVVQVSILNVKLMEIPDLLWNGQGKYIFHQKQTKVFKSNALFQISWRRNILVSGHWNSSEAQFNPTWFSVNPTQCDQGCKWGLHLYCYQWGWPTCHQSGKQRKQCKEFGHQYKNRKEFFLFLKVKY